MDRRFWFPVIVASIGVMLIAASFLLRVSRGPKPEGRAIAWIEPVFGKSYLKAFGDMRFSEVQRRANLRRGDSVETAPGSELRVALPTGEELRLQESSVVTLEWEAGRPLLIVKAGRFEIERPGTGDLVIAQDGDRVALSDWHRRRVSDSDALKTKPLARPAREIPDELRPGKPKTLSPDYIRDTLKSQKSLFFKCYTSLLQKTPGVSGEASVHFMIEKTGKVAMAEISSTSLADPAFKSCLVQAVRRVEFKSFAGEPVSTLFPLRFE